MAVSLQSRFVRPTARYALGSLGVGWFCFSRVFECCMERSVRRGRRPSDHWLAELRLRTRLAVRRGCASLSLLPQAFVLRAPKDKTLIARVPRKRDTTHDLSN